MFLYEFYLFSDEFFFLTEVFVAVRSTDVQSKNTNSWKLLFITQLKTHTEE